MLEAGETTAVSDGDTALRRRALVKALCDGLTVEAAAERAGYSARMAYMLNSSTSLADAIHAEVAQRLRIDGAPLGFRVLRELAANINTPPSVRESCARTLVKLGGHVEPKAPESQAGEKDLTDMSQDELLSVINQCEGELGKRASPVNATDSAPLTPGGTGNSVDILE